MVFQDKRAQGVKKVPKVGTINLFLNNIKKVSSKMFQEMLGPRESAAAKEIEVSH